MKCSSIVPVILKAVKSQLDCQQWKRDGGQYIPNPATWINQGRWNDEITIPLWKKEMERLNAETTG
jgi:hypothetical protein